MVLIGYNNNKRLELKQTSINNKLKQYKDMDYLIIAKKDGKELLGTDSATIVRDAKSMVKVNNAIKWFNPAKDYDTICVYSFTRLYDEKTHKLIRTIQK